MDSGGVFSGHQFRPIKEGATSLGRERGERETRERGEREERERNLSVSHSAAVSQKDKLAELIADRPGVGGPLFPKMATRRQ